MGQQFHPQVQRALDEFRARGILRADPLGQSLAHARAAARAYHAHLNIDLPDAPLVIDTVTGGNGHQVPLRIFYPGPHAENLPVLVYFHGGGFVLNSVDTHDRLLRLLALRAGVAVVAVSYRLAPEHRFPNQIHDALAAVAWLEREGEGWGLDPSRYAMGGDSAGANLALAATLALRDKGAALPAFGLLFYGMFSADLDSSSHRAFGDGRFGLSTAQMEWYWRQYLADAAQRDNPLAAPLAADLGGLPPQLVAAAGLDCLRDDSLAMAKALRAAGVDAELVIHEGMPHSFLQLSAHVPAADQAITDAAAALARHLDSEPQRERASA